jgi:hypothetical protein
MTLHHTFKSMSNSAFISENIDQELSLAELQNANGGFFLLLVSALLPGVANAPAEGDDIYTKPSLWEVAKTGSTLGESDGTQGGGTNVAPGPDGRGCTDRNLPF